MRNPLSKKVETIQPSGIRKFFDIVSEMEDVISLGVGEPDFDTPWHIRDEGIYTLEKGRTFYTSNSGLKELRVAIAEYLRRRFEVSYDPLHEILVTVGGSEGIDVALRAMLDPGDEVLIPEPCYVSYVPCVVLADGVPVTIELTEENQFRLTKEELLAAITDKTKILVMPFPNNPTGGVMRREDLEEIAQVCIEKDIYVLSDEIYSELTYGADHVSIASLPGMKERTLLINGFSKSYAMTGWRLGYICGPQVIVEQMTKIHQFAIMCAPTNSQYAAVEALRHGDADVAQMRTAYDQRRRYLMHAFKEMGLSCFEPFGAFYAFQAAAPSLGIEGDLSGKYVSYAVSDSFNGMLASKSGVNFGEKEQIDIYVPTEEDTDLIVDYVDEGKRSTSLYDSSKLKEKDQYTVFLGGNSSLLDIRTVSTSTKRLLLVKDSFANSFIPFLTPYYREIVVVDPRYYSGTINDLMDSYRISEVLFLYSGNTFFKDNNISGVFAVE